MGKKVVSGGGGGSSGQPVSWADALVEEMFPAIPPHARTCAEILAAAGNNVTPCRMHALLKAKIKAGELTRGWGRRDGKGVWYYWPTGSIRQP